MLIGIGRVSMIEVSAVKGRLSAIWLDEWPVFEFSEFRDDVCLACCIQCSKGQFGG